MPLHIIPASYDYICLGKNIPNPSEKDDREEDCDCLEEGELFKESENNKKPSANDEKGSKKKSEKDGGDPEAKVTAAGKLPEEKKHFEKFEPVEFKHASKTKKGAFTNVTQKHLKIGEITSQNILSENSKAFEDIFFLEFTETPLKSFLFYLGK